MRTMSLRSMSLTVALLAGGTLMLAACDNGGTYVDTTTDVELVEPTDAVAAEEQAAPVVAETPSEVATDAPPVESLPPEVRSSEESVQPESETLFY